jgi:hypothetical protein
MARGNDAEAAIGLDVGVRLGRMDTNMSDARATGRAQVGARTPMAGRASDDATGR